ncbi:MAG: exodeoxyribonuclease V subunit gamma [Gammaproteobacteria bacterium]|nr:exodeoxyribonuclease V subunit gamma [Gammaproteobacteria bacterium]
MAFFIQHSNRVEILQKNMARQIAESPQHDVFSPEIIVVPTFAMSRWLNLCFAQQLGIAANIEYPLPTSWLWNTAATLIADLPAEDPLNQEAMCWKIFSALPSMLDFGGFAQLRDYLDEDVDGIKRWQLSTRISSTFERYQQWRPGLIRDWSKQPDDNWQSVVWHHLVSDLKGNHRVNILFRLINLLNSPVPLVNLPARISLFAISSLPPLVIDVIYALAKHIDITLFLHSPTDHYWADLKPEKSLVHMQLQHPHHAAYYDNGNELLVSWGRQSQALQDRLLDYAALASSDAEFNRPPGSDTLLESIQQSIFNLHPMPPNHAADNSLSVHICHSPLRECQILHDQLLRLLGDNPELSSEDILIMVPEIGRYAPYIKAVFGLDNSQARPYLPWNLSDISVADEHPLIQSFLQLLKLPGSRFGYAEIMSLLEIDEIRRRFHLDEKTLGDLQEVFAATRVRWGIDGAFKASLGLPATAENTWQQARHRIFAGYALGEVGYWNGIAALPPTDSHDSTRASYFWQFFDRLESWRLVLNKPATAQQWQSRLNALIDDFYCEAAFSEDRLQQIRDAIDGLRVAKTCSITPALLHLWLDQQLNTQQQQGRLFSGGITFCGMRPMRNLPFPVICLLGMNDTAFPRRESKTDWDLIAQHRQPGDPHKGDEDRYLMLETLLCARRYFYISYTGRSLKDNTVLQPSVLVQELLDFIDEPAPNIKAGLSQEITHVHPMQPFAVANYTSKQSSYDGYWCEVVKQLQARSESVQQKSWPLEFDGAEATLARDIDLQQLQRFFRHPIRYFFNQRLSIYLDQHEADDDEERFTIEGLDAWQIKTRLAEDIVRGDTSQAHMLQAEGKLPHGSAANVELETLRERQRLWLNQLARYKHSNKRPQSLRCELETNTVLYGEVENHYPGLGLMHYTASAFKGIHLLALWLDHLALCSSRLMPEPETSTLITGDKTFTITPVEQALAKSWLLDYCAIFQLGLERTLPVYPLSSFAQANGGNVEKAWIPNGLFGANGDSQDEYIRLALRSENVQPWLNPAFTDYAHRIYARLIERSISL